MAGSDIRTRTQPLELGQATRALGIAPLAGIGVLVFSLLMGEARPHPTVLPILALYVAPFCYAAAFAFVFPVFWMWPKARRPSLLLAAVWGALAALAAAAFVVPYMGELWRWEVLTGFGTAGTASGLLYCYLSRPRVRNVR